MTAALAGKVFTALVAVLLIALILIALGDDGNWPDAHA